MACSQCGCRGSDSGWVEALKKGDPEEFPYTFVFRCNCSLGRAKPQTGIPMWSKRFELDYIPEWLWGDDAQKKVRELQDDGLSKSKLLEIFKNRKIPSEEELKPYVEKYGREVVVEVYRESRSQSVGDIANASLRDIKKP